MGRLTITLDDPLHQALKEAAARQGRTLGEIIQESLRLRGIKPVEDARSLVARARQAAQLPEEAAVELAVREAAAQRR